MLPRLVVLAGVAQDAVLGRAEVLGWAVVHARVEMDELGQAKLTALDVLKKESVPVVNRSVS